MLGVFTSSGLILPQASLTEKISQSQFDRVQVGLRGVCEVPFNILRCLAFETNEQDHRTDALYLLEARLDNFSFGDLPLGLGWIPLDDLTSEMVPKALSNGLSSWRKGWTAMPFQGMVWQPPPLSPPWSRPGWLLQAETWINAEVTKLGEKVRAIEPLKSWCISSVLRVHTTSRPVFFKASLELPLFVNEGVVMAGLAQLYPDYIPAPLAVNAARNWMLLEDLGKPIRRDAPFELKAGLFQAMAEMQIDSSQRLDSLLRMGCIDRRIPWLQAHLDWLLADEITLSKITPSEREELRRALPRLQELLTELDSLPIPAALVHGDLHPGNVAVQDGKIQIFDWTDASISHPFFDLDVIFSAEDLNLREELEDAYLCAWEQVYPVEVVRRAFKLARVVYGLYHAVSYQYILNNLEEVDHPEINSAHYFFHQVLAGLAASHRGAFKLFMIQKHE